jgi:hypothetical protein
MNTRASRVAITAVSLAMIAVVICQFAAAVEAALTPIAIHVGPQTRNGFVDIDRGVLDSIKDLKTELRGKSRFLVVDERCQT